MMINAIEEANYNARAAVPDFARHFASWRERSEALRARARGMVDIPYGTHAKARLDLFPARATKAPLHVFIHGGYWQALDKSDQSFVAGTLNEDGVSVALLNYALCPEVTLDTIVAQVREGVAWLWRNAVRIGCDPDRITVSGHSAGGHLVGMLMATDWRGLGPDLPQDLLKAGVAISGLFELRPLIDTTINAKVGIDEAVAARMSPARLRPLSRASLLLVVGEQESRGGFHWQSDELIHCWQDKGPALARLTLLGANHFTVIEGLVDRTSPLLRRLLALAHGRV